VACGVRSAGYDARGIGGSVRPLAGSGSGGANADARLHSTPLQVSLLVNVAFSWFPLKVSKLSMSTFNNSCPSHEKLIEPDTFA
jgi:hypothetical protein